MIGRKARWIALAASVTALAAAGVQASPAAYRAWDGAAVAGDQIERALAADPLVLRLDAGDRLRLFDETLSASSQARVMAALSSEFLTVAVTSGQARLGDGPVAGPGQVLLVTLDGRRVQRLAFDARRLQATLSPGARPLIGADLAALAQSQRRGAFWGRYEPLQVNARAPASPAMEWMRQSYLSQPAIVRQRRDNAGSLDATKRAAAAAQGFVASFASGDADAVSALLDPYPFLAGTNPEAAMAARRDAAAALLADPALKAALGASALVSADPGGGSATIVAGAQRWRLGLVVRDRALFVTSLEPKS